jgi:hypothetical protein
VIAALGGCGAGNGEREQKDSSTHGRLPDGCDGDAQRT